MSEALMHDVATLGTQMFACRYDRTTGTVYTHAFIIGFVRGDVLEVGDKRLGIVDGVRQGGVTRLHVEEFRA